VVYTFVWPYGLEASVLVLPGLNNKLRPIATDEVTWSDCMSVCWSRSWALHKQLNRSRCRLGWVGNTSGSKWPLLDGVEILSGKGNFGVVRPSE